MRRCQECVWRAHSPTEPLQAHDVPQQAWECIVMDHFYVNGRLYVLVSDYLSKFPFVFQTKTTSFVNLRDHLQELFMIEGTPDEIISDNGPPFNGKDVNAFLTGLGIRHTTSSPNYPQSNGFIERQIQMVKRLMEKATSTEKNFQEALSSLIAHPLADGLPSPVEILHGRSLVTRKATPVDLVAVHQSLKLLCRPSTSRTMTGPGKWRPSNHWWLVRRYWEKLWHTDRQGYITEEEQVPSQAKKLWHSNNIWLFQF